MFLVLFAKFWLGLTDFAVSISVITFSLKAAACELNKMKAVGVVKANILK